MPQKLKQAVTKESVKDDQKFPTVKVAYLNRLGVATVCEPYGFHSSAPNGSPCLLITVGDDEANRYVIPLSAMKRTKGLSENEVEVGNMTIGSLVTFKANGDIEIVSQKGLLAQVDGDVTAQVGGDVNLTAEGTVTITSPLITLDGDVIVTKGIWIQDEDLTGSIFEGLISNLAAISGIGTIASNGIGLSTHKHTGVVPGGGISGGPTP